MGNKEYRLKCNLMIDDWWEDKELIEKYITAWKADENLDPQDQLHEYFSEIDMWDWCDTADEARKIYDLMPDEYCKKGLFGPVAAAANWGAYAAVAAALNVDAELLRTVISPWEEGQNNLPPPCGIDGLQALLDEEVERREKVREENRKEKAQS